MKNLTRSFLLAGIVVMLAILPQLITVKYYLQLVTLALIWVVAAQGQNIIQGFTGYVSITQAGLMGIGAYSSTLLCTKLGLPVWLSLVCAPVITSLFALVVGYPCLRVKGHYFAIVTLAYNMVIVTVLTHYSSLTNGEAGIPNIPRPESIGDGLIDFTDRQTYYYLVAVVALALTLLASRIVASRVGRIMLAIRENEAFAVANGIAVWKYKLFAFVASGFYASIAGSLYAHYQGFINPESFGVAQSLDAILAVILGGSGTIVGPVIGAFAITFLPEMLRFTDSFRLVIYGALLVVATIFMPKGVASLIERAWRVISKSWPTRRAA